MTRHPSKHELLEHAENLLVHRPISAKIGGHIASCKACQAELEGVRASFDFIAEARELEPTSDFTAQILMAAQNERRIMNAKRSRLSLVASAAKIAGYAAAVLVIGTVCFSAALVKQANTDQAAFGKKIASSTAIAPDSSLKNATDIRTLAAAVDQPSKKKPSLWEVEHRRTVRALNADIEAAQAALERNPGCDRATRIMANNLQRQAQALKALYLERAL
jgi:hypothetical protein